MTFPPEVWDAVLCRLRAELTLQSCEAWLAPLIPLPHADGLRILCPTRFHLNRVRDALLERISHALQSELGELLAIELVVPSDLSGEVAEAADTAVRSAAERAAAAPRQVRERTSAKPAARPARSDVLPQPARSRAVNLGFERETLPLLDRTFQNFVVGPCNALAREASLALAEGRQAGLDQVYLTSATGLGKTHLARAVLAAARRDASPGALYLSAEAFTNAFLKSIQTKQQAEFKRQLRERCRVLIVDDVQFFEGKKSTQLEFFHTVDHLLSVGGRVLLTADRPPSLLANLDSRLHSQLGGGFMAELEPPDAQVRRNILRGKAAAGGVGLPDDCLDLLVRSVKGSVRDLEGALIQLVATASLLKKPIDLGLTREALRTKVQALDDVPRRLEPRDVVAQVASFFKTTPEALASRSRRSDVLVPRQLAMYLCHRYTDASFSAIGRRLGRDHPSVRNAIAKVERAMLERVPTRYQVEALVARLDEMVETGEA